MEDQLDGGPRWEAVHESRGIAVVKNRRARPRAWLVSSIEPVSSEQALRQIRGESRDDPDFARVALVELGKAPLPVVSGGNAPGDIATTRQSANGRIVVDTSSAKDSFLVVSEIYFPGWEATVDGNAARIYQTDYLLMGVAVPAGSHRVEMRYRAHAAATGAAISMLTLGALIALGIYSWRRWRVAGPPREAAPHE